MSPLSPAVLTAATVVSSPALWSALVDQTMPLDVALTRYLVAVLICWAVIGVVAEFAFPAPGSVRSREAQEALKTRESSSPEEGDAA